MRVSLAILLLLIPCAPQSTDADAALELRYAEYQQAYALDPQNAFYQYAVLATARRLGADPPNSVRRVRTDRWQTGIYEFTTGAAAVQESLQLDRIVGSGDAMGAATVEVANIEGVTTPSIPFEELRQGRIPVIEPVASAVPGDFYYIHAPRVSAMRAVLDAAERWGAHLLSAYTLNGRDTRLREKLEAQLLLRTAPELDPLFDLAIDGVAIVGSDPFVVEGGDVSVVFALKNALVFRTYIDAQRRTGASDVPSGLGVVQEQYREWTIDGITSPDRSLSSFVAVRGRWGVVSNSLVAIRAVIDTVERIRPSIAIAPDYRYMRAIKPYLTTHEDGFLFLSDEFVRHVVGPESKIGEARRVRCAVSLQTIAYATILFRTETDRAPESLQELTTAKYLAETDLRCPDGGLYSLDGETPVCSAHNRLRRLTPNLEMALLRVTPEEAESYRIFRENYKNYWRRYLDPVGIRIRTGLRLEVEATILPVVENSAYRSFADAVGTEAADLARPQLSDAIATFDVKLPVVDRTEETARSDRIFGIDGGRLFGEALGGPISIQLVDSAPTIPMDLAGMGRGIPVGGFDDWIVYLPLLYSLSMPTVVTAPVRDRAALEACLSEFRAAIRSEGVDSWLFRVSDYRIVQGGARTVETVSVEFLFVHLRFYYAIVNDRFVVATDRALVDRMAEAAPAGNGSGSMRLELVPDRWKAIAPSIALAYAENAREICIRNLSWLAALRGAYEKPPHELAPESLALLGAAFVCPDGGRYVPGLEASVECVVHGTREAPRQGPRPQPGSPAAYVLENVRRIETVLSFTSDGISTNVLIDQRP